MSSKAEISWKRRLEDGTRHQVYAQHVGNRWKFFAREVRFDMWMPLTDPPLEDWLELLDAVRRRIARDLIRPEEEHKLISAILERYPEAEV
jgi:hypothetical protein